MTGSGILIPGMLRRVKDVVIVHRGGGNAQHHLVARRLRIGKVLVQLQAIPLAVPDCDDRSHCSRLPGGERSG